MERLKRFTWVIVACLVGLFALQSFTASQRKSPVFDEPPHIASGLSYLAAHVFYANPQHPPLLKELSALSLRSRGIVWPDSPEARLLTQGAPDGANREWAIGNQIIASNGPDRVMFWGRLPFIVLATGLGLVLYLWGRAMLGPTAALGALFFYALDPTIIGHSFLVTTDVGVTAFTVLFLFTLWHYLQRPHWWRLVLCGLTLGLALGAKFSAVLLIPLAAIFLAVNAWRPSTPANASNGPLGIGRAIVAFLVMSAIAVAVIDVLYFSPSGPFLYAAGFSRLNADHLVGQQAFFNGEFSSRFYSYFVAAYLLKEPLPAIILAIGGLVLLWRSSSTPLLTKLFLLLPPAFFLLTVTFKADDLGIRYIMPALPFVCLIGGFAFARLVGGTLAWGRPVAAALCVWLSVGAAGIYPDHLSYFNEAACLLTDPGQIGWDGGSRCGPLWLDDSNVDWGQGVKQLRSWVAEHGNGRPLKLAYFGTFPPEHYGLVYEKVDPATLMARPAPGLYAVSAFWIGRIPAAVKAVAPGATSWIAATPPVAIVGHAFYIFDIQ